MKAAANLLKMQRRTTFDHAVIDHSQGFILANGITSDVSPFALLTSWPMAMIG